MPIIKRYPNRKLYDTSAKKYITLEEISLLIQQGEDIRVIDNKTSEDITALTLSQIILEQEKKHAGILPRSVLTSLIRSGGDRISALQKSLVSQLNVSKVVNDEIRHRVELLIKSNYLTEEEGIELIAELVQIGETETRYKADRLQDTLAVEEQFESFINAQGYPTKDDLQQLSNQLDELSTKLEKIGSAST
jgi:polyhydroxyalkanoate synthesis repressor PhaR